MLEERSERSVIAICGVALTGFLHGACDSSSADRGDAIAVGAVLPFSGPLATTGGNLERALILAVEDVNAAGGIGGRPFVLEVGDSNSGSERGLQRLLSLLYEKDVHYLIGPEENNLATEIVRDIKGLDRLNLLPSYTAPSISDSGQAGAWVIMAPSAQIMGCALATKAFNDGVRTTSVVATRDTYHLEFASIFSSVFADLGGVSLPTVTVAEGLSSYSAAVAYTQKYHADASALLAYPKTAASIVLESEFDEQSRWYLSPLLRDDAFLWNVPGDQLENSRGATPSLSDNGECNGAGGDDDANDERSNLGCEQVNAERFRQHFAARWHGERPLQSAHYYYDSVILLALGLQSRLADGDEMPSPRDLQRAMVAAANPDGERVSWEDAKGAIALAGSPSILNYVGAAGAYEFDRNGRNIRAIVSTWSIQEDHFVDQESVRCQALNPD